VWRRFSILLQVCHALSSCLSLVASIADYGNRQIAPLLTLERAIERFVSLIPSTAEFLRAEAHVVLL